MALHLVTGYKGSAHVTAADQGLFNAGSVGLNEYVFCTGSRFEAEIVNNNLVRVYDGSLLMQGRHVVSDSTEDLSISNCASSSKRNDFIVMRYTRDVSTGVESVNLMVVEGGTTVGTPVDPYYYSSGNILNGTTMHDMPLYRVRVVGLTIERIEPLFQVLAPMADIQHGFYKQNLLINGDFQCNQRDLTSYDATGTVLYSVDMWRAHQVKVDVLNEGVKVTGVSATVQGYFTQFIQLGKLETKTYTISAMVDGKICTFTVTPGGTAKEKNFGTFKISALTTSAWDDSLPDYDYYNNKLKINICPVGTNAITIKYVDVFEGVVAYPHVKEDYATALMRCKQYIQRSCYTSPIAASTVMNNTTGIYTYYICHEKLLSDNTENATEPNVCYITGSYPDTNSGTGAFSFSNADANEVTLLTNMDGMFRVRVTSARMHDDCHMVKGVYVVTSEPLANGD